MFGSFPPGPWLVWQPPKSTRVDGSRHCYGINERWAKHLCPTVSFPVEASLIRDGLRPSQTSNFGGADDSCRASLHSRNLFSAKGKGCRAVPVRRPRRASAVDLAYGLSDCPVLFTMDIPATLR
jgi:hypothetical protein